MIITDDLVKGFIDRLERQGYTKDYIDGALEGMSWVIEFYQTMRSLEKTREKLIREEHNVST